METTTAMTAGGLEGVVVADTRLSEVDGERGRLVVAGHDIERLALAASFEDVVGLLGTGALPDAAGREAQRRALAEGRVLAFARLAGCGDAFERVDGMDSLRASVGHLEEGGAGAAARLIGAVGVYAAAWARVRAGGRPLAPDPGLSHAADYLRMSDGREPEAARVAGLDAYLVTVADHGLNASTFAARVVTSTGSDMVSAIVAAIGALKGPLHGGAPGPVLDMLDAVGSPDGAAAWIEAELAAGRRIMGMGHRIYRVRDPRAAVLERAIVGLEVAGLEQSGAIDRAPGAGAGGRAGGGGGPAAQVSGAAAGGERRVLYGGAARYSGHRSRRVLADLRGRTGGGLVRARARAAGRGAADPSGVALRRAGAGVRVTGRRSALR
jgi:citrate synthase